MNWQIWRSWIWSSPLKQLLLWNLYSSVIPTECQCLHNLRHPPWPFPQSWHPLHQTSGYCPLHTFILLHPLQSPSSGGFSLVSTVSYVFRNQCVQFPERWPGFLALSLVITSFPGPDFGPATQAQRNQKIFVRKTTEFINFPIASSRHHLGHS